MEGFEFNMVDTGLHPKKKKVKYKVEIWLFWFGKIVPWYLRGKRGIMSSLKHTRAVSGELCHWLRHPAFLQLLPLEVAIMNWSCHSVGYVKFSQVVLTSRYLVIEHVCSPGNIQFLLLQFLPSAAQQLPFRKAEVRVSCRSYSSWERK